MGLLALFAWLAALGSWGYQVYGWVQHGYWEPLPLNAALHIEGTDLTVFVWQWAVPIVMAVLDWNLGIGLAVLGTPLFMAYVFQED